MARSIKFYSVVDGTFVSSVDLPKWHVDISKFSDYVLSVCATHSGSLFLDIQIDENIEPYLIRIQNPSLVTGNEIFEIALNSGLLGPVHSRPHQCRPN